MRLKIICAALVLIASVACAKDNHCSVSAGSSEHENGVTIQKVIVSGDWGKTDATAFLPDPRSPKL
jgi:hypothetical protein